MVKVTKSKRVPLLKSGKRFAQGEILRTIDKVARKNKGVVKITEVYTELRKNGYSVNYSALSRLVKKEIQGTGYKLYRRR